MSPKCFKHWRSEKVSACQHETGNSNNVYTVTVETNTGIVVGPLLRRISRVLDTGGGRRVSACHHERGNSHNAYTVIVDSNIGLALGHLLRKILVARSLFLWYNHVSGHKQLASVIKCIELEQRQSRLSITTFSHLIIDFILTEQKLVHEPVKSPARSIILAQMAK